MVSSRPLASQPHGNNVQYFNHLNHFNHFHDFNQCICFNLIGFLPPPGFSASGPINFNSFFLLNILLSYRPRHRKHIFHGAGGRAPSAGKIEHIRGGAWCKFKFLPRPRTKATCCLHTRASVETEKNLYICRGRERSQLLRELGDQRCGPMGVAGFCEALRSEAKARLRNLRLCILGLGWIS